MKLHHLNPLVFGVIFVVFPATVVPAQTQTAANRPIPNGTFGDLETQLKLAGDNRVELEKALKQIEPDFRDSVLFLIGNMSNKDLQSIKADLLLENVRLAHEARREVPWGSSIPQELFFNDVLPYANVDETRESWRKPLKELCLPIVEGCRTPSEAAQRLNEQLFQKVKVKYSTARKKANQSPSESMQQGLASCTGLSILLTDACRSVCIPARLAGIPSWPNKRGNHTWVEIWDRQWHFTGAAEPNPQGLNHAWFENDAALAHKESRLNAIYAVSFRKTDTIFPMVWSRGSRQPIYAVNVTDRYTKGKAKASDQLVNAMIRIWTADRSERIVAQVTLQSKQDGQTGKSRGQTADMNDMLVFRVAPNQKYSLEIEFDGQTMRRELAVDEGANQVFDIAFAHDPAATEKASLAPEHEKLLYQFFSSDEASVEFPAALQQQYEQDPMATRLAIWNAYLKSPLALSSKADYDNQRVTFGKHLSPFTVKEVGTRPAGGWPLFIAMHGGGGAPARVNDSQWRHMQIYYKDQASVEGYKYLALRAPNDTWNGFYDNYVYPLIENLVAQMIIHGDVDPNKVFLLGYSHGGYGAFAIGPKIPHRFAAIHSSAAAPTDGESSAKTLRNTRFTFMIGERDKAYGRRERCEKFSKWIDELKADNPGHYPVQFLYRPGYGHGGLPDRDMIGKMYDAVRNPIPKHLTWELTDPVVDHFYWLSTDQPDKQKEIDAAIEGNQISIATKSVSTFSIWLDQRLIDASQPVTITLNGGDQRVEDYRPSVATFCESLRNVRDPSLAFDFEISYGK